MKGGRLQSVAEVVAAAAEDQLLVVTVLIGEIYFGGGVGGDENVPFEVVSFSLPFAFDEAADGLVGAVHMVEAFDRIGLQHYLAVAWSQRPYSTEVFVIPDDEVAKQHHVVARVHGGVGGVAIPQLPDGGGTAPHHVAPAGVGGVGGYLQRQITTAVVGEGAH